MRLLVFVVAFVAIGSNAFAQIEHKLDSLRQEREGLLLDGLYKAAYQTYLCEQLPGTVAAPESSALMLQRSMKYYRGLREAGLSPLVFTLTRLQALSDILKSMRAVSYSLEIQEDIKKYYPEAARHSCGGKHCHCAPGEASHHK